METNLADNLNKRFGDNLRDARQAADLSRKELAERCSLHWTMVAGIEEGKRRVSLDATLRLAKALDIAPERLWAGPK